MNRFCHTLYFVVICSIAQLHPFTASGQKRPDNGNKKTILFRTNNPDSFLEKKLKRKYEYVDTSRFQSILGDKIREWRKNGYLESSVDSIVQNKENITEVWLHTGGKYYFGNLLLDSVLLHYVQDKKFYTSMLAGNVFSYELLQRNLDNIIKQLENKAYPFAKIITSEAEIINNTVNLSLQLQPGPLIRWDSIKTEGSLKISTWFISNATGIYPEKPYSEIKLNQVQKALSNYPFIEPVKEIKLEFLNDKAIPVIRLDQRKTNMFSGIAGIGNQDQASEKTTITGELKIHLNNTFKIGESILFEWQKPGANSQNLFCQLSLPFIMKAPLGLNTQLTLEKRDTLYLNTSQELGVVIKTSASNNISGFYRGKQSSTLGENPQTNKETNADFDMWLYGLKLEYVQLDYPFNPRKGLSLITDIALGSKKTNPGKNIADSVLRKMDLNSNQYEWNLETRFFIPVKKKFCFMLGFHAWHMTHYLNGIDNGKNLFFENEFKRTGGLKSIRGFDELSIKASSFGITNVEFRVLPDKSSNIFIFIDHAFIEKRGLFSISRESLTGIGSGLNMETKAGIFTLVYALGKYNSKDFLLKSAKVHFGYSARF